MRGDAVVRGAPVREIEHRLAIGLLQNRGSVRPGLSVRRETQIARDHRVAQEMTGTAIEMTAMAKVGPPAHDERERQG